MNISEMTIELANKYDCIVYFNLNGIILHARSNDTALNLLRIYDYLEESKYKKD
jgi:hypothetical protein